MRVCPLTFPATYSALTTPPFFIIVPISKKTCLSFIRSPINLISLVTAPCSKTCFRRSDDCIVQADDPVHSLRGRRLGQESPLCFANRCHCHIGRRDSSSVQ